MTIDVIRNQELGSMAHLSFIRLAKIAMSCAASCHMTWAISGATSNQQYTVSDRQESPLSAPLHSNERSILPICVSSRNKVKVTRKSQWLHSEGVTSLKSTLERGPLLTFVFWAGQRAGPLEAGPLVSVNKISNGPALGSKVLGSWFCLNWPHGQMILLTRS